MTVVKAHLKSTVNDLHEHDRAEKVTERRHHMPKDDEKGYRRLLSENPSLI